MKADKFGTRKAGDGECRTGSFSGTESSLNLTCSQIKKKKQVSPILEIIFGVFGRYLADIDDLFLF